MAALTPTRIRLGDQDRCCSSSMARKFDFAQQKLSGTVIEFHGLKYVVATLIRITVERDDKPRIGAKQNDPGTLKACALQAAAREHECVVMAKRLGKCGKQILDRVDPAGRQQRVQRGKIEAAPSHRWSNHEERRQRNQPSHRHRFAAGDHK